MVLIVFTGIMCAYVSPVSTNYNPDRPVLLASSSRPGLLGLVCISKLLSSPVVSRDRAVPFSNFLVRLDSNAQPRNALVVQSKPGVTDNVLRSGAAAIQVVILCISLGSTTAFYAFINVGIISVNVSYGIPIAISMCNRRKQISSAPFFLGRWGWIPNALALAWVSFSLVLFCMVRQPIA